MARRPLVIALAAFSLVTGCAGGPGGGYGFGSSFRLIEPRTHSVARSSMEVTPTVPWNRVPRGVSDLRREESWTLNGPLLDGVSFIGGLENGKAIVRQHRSDERQVPVFRSDMSPIELAAMIESFYRTRGGSVRFEMTGMQPRQFLGYPGFQFDYDHLGGNELERRGRAVGAIIDGRFYLALFDAARAHYFPAGLPEFERIVASARLG